MTNLNPTDVAYATIAHVPGHMQGIGDRVWIEPHYLGRIETAAQRDHRSNFYQLADEGIEPVEITTQTKDECVAALMSAAASRGWLIELHDEPDTVSHWHDGSFVKPAA